MDRGTEEMKKFNPISQRSRRALGKKIPEYSEEILSGKWDQSPAMREHIKEEMLVLFNDLKKGKHNV